MDFKNERLMMTKEEARNRAKELLNENQADLLTKYMFLEQQCKKYKDNWNKLKEYVGVEWYSYDDDSVEFEVAKDILNKIQELERSDSNE